MTGSRREPEWVERFFAELERGEDRVSKRGRLIFNRSADFAGVTRQRVEKYAEENPAFRKRLLVAIARLLLAHAEKLAA